VRFVGGGGVQVGRPCVLRWELVLLLRGRRRGTQSRQDGSTRAPKRLPWRSRRPKDARHRCGIYCVHTQHTELPPAADFGPRGGPKPLDPLPIDCFQTPNLVLSLQKAAVLWRRGGAEGMAVPGSRLGPTPQIMLLWCAARRKGIDSQEVIGNNSPWHGSEAAWGACVQPPVLPRDPSSKAAASWLGGEDGMSMLMSGICCCRASPSQIMLGILQYNIQYLTRDSTRFFQDCRTLVFPSRNTTTPPQQPPEAWPKPCDPRDCVQARQPQAAKQANEPTGSPNEIPRQQNKALVFTTPHRPPIPKIARTTHRQEMEHLSGLGA